MSVASQVSEHFFKKKNPPCSAQGYGRQYEYLFIIIKVSTEDNVLDKFRFALIPDEHVVFPEEIVHEILYP